MPSAYLFDQFIVNCVHGATSDYFVVFCRFFVWRVLHRLLDFVDKEV